METDLWSFFSVLLGGLITWAVARIYYVKASKDLREEANRLNERNQLIDNTTQIVALALEEAGLAELTKDASGDASGRVVSIILHRKFHDTVKLELEASSDIQTFPVDQLHTE